MHELGPLVGLVLGVVAVSALARAWRLPAPLLLVAAGVVVSLVPGAPDYHLDPEIVLVVLLPPLLYAAALNSSLLDIRRYARPIGLLSVGAVLVTTVAVGFALHTAVPSVPLAAAMALGAIVAPPDAVAASAIGRRSGLGRKTLTVLEGESLFNDATALVALRVALAATAGSITVLEAGRELVVAAVGGVAVGLAVGWLLNVVRQRVHDSLTDTALSLVAPFAAFLPAEELHASGVVAVVVAGLLVAHRAPLYQDPRARLVGTSTWSMIQFLLEGAVFALIGLQLRHILGDLDASAGELVLSVAVVLAVVILVRPLWVFGTTYLLRLNPSPEGGTPGWRPLAVVSWAGLRGVVSLAAALALPLDMPRRGLLLGLTVAVILGTLGVQGFTLPAVIRKLGIRPPDPRLDDLQVANALESAVNGALDRLGDLVADERTPEPIIDRLRRGAELRTWIAWERLGDAEAGEPPTAMYRRLRREMILAERQELVRLRDAGQLDDELLRRVQQELDLEDALLDTDEEADRPEDAMAQLVPERLRLCDHLRSATDPEPPDVQGCEECLALGWEWVHLRQCTTCGHVGCCDSSRGHHARVHYESDHHPVMRSVEPGESWRWCFVDNQLG